MTLVGRTKKKGHLRALDNAIEQLTFVCFKITERGDPIILSRHLSSVIEGAIDYQEYQVIKLPLTGGCDCDGPAAVVLCGTEPAWEDSS